jgi:hypothetical protein
MAIQQEVKDQMMKKKYCFRGFWEIVAKLSIMLTVLVIIALSACEIGVTNTNSPKLPTVLRDTEWVDNNDNRVKFGTNTVTVITSSGTQRTFTLQKIVTISELSQTTLHFGSGKLSDYIVYRNGTIAFVNLGGVQTTGFWTKTTSNGNNNNNNGDDDDDDDDDDDPNLNHWYPPSSYTPLIMNQWMDGSIYTRSGVWYSFSVISGNQYYIWWNDRHNGNNTKTLYAEVSAWYSNGDSIFIDKDYAWSTPMSFTARSSDTIYVKVSPYTTISFISSGTYSIVYSTGNTRPGNDDADDPNPNFWELPSSHTPLIMNQWIDGSIYSSSSEAWYSFSVINGDQYYIWWNDKYHGNNTKTLDVKVSAWYSNGDSIFTDIDFAWSSPMSFTANSSCTVYVKVSPFGTGTGTYGIAYKTNDTRPGVDDGSDATPNFNSLNIIPLTKNQWVNGSIDSPGDEVWYSFPYNSDMKYCIWWNDSKSGDGSKTADILVDIWEVDISDVSFFDGRTYLSKNTLLRSSIDSAWDSSHWWIYYKSISSFRTGTFCVRVYSPNTTGTFSIIYSTSSEEFGVVPMPTIADVEFIGLTADGSAMVPTTKLSLQFDQDIPGLTAEDIFLYSGSTGAEKGTLSKIGMGEYEIVVYDITKDGQISVYLDKKGYNIDPRTKDVTVFAAPGSGIINITFFSAPLITGQITISLSGNNGSQTATLTVENSIQYNSINWYISGTKISKSGASFTLDSSETNYNSIGDHFLTVEVIKDGVPYNRTVTFTVVQ